MKKTILLLLLLGQVLFVFAQKAKPTDPELQQLKANLAAAKHDTTRMMAYLDIITYFNLVALQPDSALVYVSKVEPLAEKHPNYREKARVWNKIGVIYSSLFLIGAKNKKLCEQKCLHYFQKAMADAKRLDNEEILLKSWFNLNGHYNETGKYYLFYKGSLELTNYINSKDNLNKLDSLVLRVTYKKLCISLDYMMGSKLFNHYLTIFKKFTSSHEGKDYESLCLLEFENYANTWKKYDEKGLLDIYNAYKQSVKLPTFNDRLNLYLADYYFANQDYKKAFQLSNTFSTKNYTENNLKLAHLGVKYMNMGKSAFMLNRNQEAIRYLNKAIGYINPVKNINDLTNEKYTTLHYLGKAYKKAGNYQQALACNEQADVLYKQMHDVGVQAMMAENDVHLEEIKQEKKVQAARTQTLLREQEIKLEKRKKNILMVVSILALLSAAWAVFSFNKTRKQNQIISQQAAALEESNHLKDKIFALLSHDLRSPINRLVVSLNQSIESQRSAIQSELKGVQDILNNILYWASMQLKKTTPAYTNVPLQALADELIDEYHYALEDKSLTFLNNIDSKVLVKTDEGYLKIVLRNLISNAIKFTPSNGYIQIACQITPQNVEIILKDTGVGIAAQQIESLFQLPVPTVGTKQEKGTGLGLSLSADIVKKLGGTIQLKSQEGKGTQVVVALPAVA